MASEDVLYIKIGCANLNVSRLGWICFKLTQENIKEAQYVKALKMTSVVVDMPRLRHIREGKKLKLLLCRSPTRDPLTRINPRAPKRFTAAHLLVQLYIFRN